MSDSLWPHESQHARPPCPSPTPGVHSDSCPSSHWCHPAISSSVIPFSSCLQSLPASESFPVSQLFAWGGQSTGVSALTSFLPKKSQTDSKWEDLSWKLNVFSFQQVNPAFTNILLPPLPKSLKRNYLNYHHLSLRNCYLEWISHSSQRVYISD